MSSSTGVVGVMCFVPVGSQMGARCVTELTVSRGTARGHNGGRGASVRDLVEWVSSREYEPSSALGSTVRGVKTSSKGTWTTVSVTSSPAEVSQPE